MELKYVECTRSSLALSKLHAFDALQNPPKSYERSMSILLLKDSVG